MNLEVTLTETELKEAIKDYVTRNMHIDMSSIDTRKFDVQVEGKTFKMVQKERKPRGKKSQ